MRRPTRESIEGLRPISRSLSLDLVAAIGSGSRAPSSRRLLPTIARRGGLEPLGLAALAAAPFLTNLLSVFAGRFGPQSTRQFALLRGIGAGSLVALLVIPGAPVIVAVAFVFWISISFSSPFQLRFWGATYPGRMRGRVVGFLGTGRAAAAADRGARRRHPRRPARRPDGGRPGRDSSGVGCALAYAGLPGVDRGRAARLLGPRFDPGHARAPDAPAGRPGAGLLRRRVHRRRAPVRPGLRRPAGPVALGRRGHRRLRRGRDHRLVPGLGCRRRPVRRRSPRCATAASSGSPGCSATPLAPGLAVLLVAALAIGVANSSIEVGIAGVISDHTPLASRAAAMSGWNAITGARGLVAPFFMSALVQFGVVSVTVGLLMCASASALGVVLFWWAARRARAGSAIAVATAG